MKANNAPSVRELALAVLSRMRDSAWDSPGTVDEGLSQGRIGVGTVKIAPAQGFNPDVSVSHALGTGTVGQRPKSGTAHGTVAGQPQAQMTPSRYARAFSTLCEHCPAYIEPDRWQQAVEDGSRFLRQWGDKAAALGWTAEDLFGLHTPPEQPHPSYQRLSRYDELGLIWLLCGRPVVALTATSAAIESATRPICVYRKKLRVAQ
jgi:hypothetical protein